MKHVELNPVYQEIQERLGLKVAEEIYAMFKGQQVSFPMRFYSPAYTKKCIIEEYNGNNMNMLALKYGYSEKTVRRIVRGSG